MVLISAVGFNSYRHVTFWYFRIVVPNCEHVNKKVLRKEVYTYASVFYVLQSQKLQLDMQTIKFTKKLLK